LNKQEHFKDNSFLRRFKINAAAKLAIVRAAVALVKDGDRVRINTVTRQLDLLVDEAVLAERRKDFKPVPHKYTRGVLAKYAKLVGSASKGAVCD